MKRTLKNPKGKVDRKVKDIISVSSTEGLNDLISRVSMFFEQVLNLRNPGNQVGEEI